MSARTTRAATAGSLALALALALPAAAFADEDGRGDAAAERSDDRGRSETAPHGSDRQPSGADPDERADQDERAAQRADRDGAGAPSSEEGGSRSEARSDGEDPRGNNGTVKIDGEPFDDGRGNEPHVGCTFAVDFYGFDAGDTATITFTGHAPTGGGLLHSESRTISTDPAGGGQDRDATFVYSVDDQLSELRAVTPHAQQGWHVKLAVDVDSAPGGAKQKVFWIDCPAPASPATTLGGGTTTTPLGGATTDAATFSPRSTVLPTSVLAGTTVAAAERRDALTLGAARATLAAGSGSLSAQGSVQPSVLPFTGTQALIWLLATGLAAIGVGALVHRMGRASAALG